MAARDGRQREFSRGAIGAHRNERRTCGRSKPREFVLMYSFEFSHHMRAGAHQPRGDRCHMDVVARQFGANRIGTSQPQILLAL